MGLINMVRGRRRQPPPQPTERARGIAPPRAGLFAETLSYDAVLLILAAAYLVAAVHALLHRSPADGLPVPPAGAPFGFRQLARLGWGGLMAVLAALPLSSWALAKWREPLAVGWERVSRFVSRRSGAVLVSAGFVLLFFLLRNQALNPDGSVLGLKFAREIPLRGYHATHDEILELFVHSRFWFYTHHWFGWSVELSYQVLSCLAGGVFAFFLLRFAGVACPGNPLGLFLLTISGGFMQLYFGDVENYTLTGALIMLYLYASARHLRGDLSVAVPSVILGVAISFHLLAGWLLPSLAYLYVRQLRRRRFRGPALGALSIAAIWATVLLGFHFHGLPLRELVTTSHVSAYGGHPDQVLAAPSARYLWDQVNLLLLLFPGALFAVPLLVSRRVDRDPLPMHLLIATCSLLAFQAVWKAQLGVYNDWNLFANVAVPFSLLVWTNVLRERLSDRRKAILVAFFLLSAFHSYAWIISNHTAVPVRWLRTASGFLAVPLR